MGRAILAAVLALVIGSAVFIPLMRAFPDIVEYAGVMVCAEGSKLSHSMNRITERHGTAPTLGFNCRTIDGSLRPVNGLSAGLSVWGIVVAPIFLAFLFLFRKRSSSPSVNVTIGSSPQSIDPARLAQDLSKHLSGGNVIQAIKVVRQFSNMGLKESKDMVEALRSGKMQISELIARPGGSIVVSGEGGITGETAAERLRKLDELKAQRLVTEEEYAAKRKEILADI